MKKTYFILGTLTSVLICTLTFNSYKTASVADKAKDPTFYSDIYPIIGQKCLTCHSEKGVSFSFENPETSYQFKEAMTLAVKQKRMPPWLAKAGHQTYVDDYSLNHEEISLFEQWSNTGFKKGSPDQANTKPVSIIEKKLFHPDLKLPVLPGQRYLPNQNKKDDYRCFVVDWPYQEDKYITGFKGMPGNLKIAHHLVAHVITPEMAPVIKYLEKQEKGAGYQCFGGAVPDRLGNKKEKENFELQYPDGVKKLNDSRFWLSHWAPGMSGYEFPQDTGILVQAGSVLVIQIHYYSAFAPGESDQGSMMEFQVSDHVTKPSFNFPLTQNKWLTGKRNKSMVIPAGQKRSFDVSTNFTEIAKEATRILKLQPNKINSIELHSVNIHMHSYGISGKTTISDGKNNHETLLEIPRWDLNWQRDFTLTQPKIIKAQNFKDTRLSVQCDFANHTNKPVYGGFGSDDEMCFNFSYVSVVTQSE
ncbi:MAG: hypothetical protein HRT37_26105 [Alteromonadaceae bacterium]|nr:hypothetical protein [Alteromonadaceae bacterium]